ncbi:unnamed protein product [marine sediment metagenome]|uniref:Uncharacterized protein n=1 Tax=marine sediment metagenome TaxID=412755 RepID=X1DA91_9ZZZZ
MGNLTATKEQVYKLVKQLSPEEREFLFEQLQKEFIVKRWDSLLKRIDERKKKCPITDEEIEKEVKFAWGRFAHPG